MKRLLVALTLMGTVLVMSSGVALAALNSIDCPNRADGTCVGTDGSDSMEGTNLSDKISGLNGNDTIRALGRGDFVHGNVGNDTLYGQEGGDTLKGDTGTDTLVGREGNDALSAGRDLNPDVVSCGPGTDSASVSVGDLVQTESGDEVRVLATTVESDLELATTCETINIIIVQ